MSALQSIDIPALLADDITRHLLETIVQREPAIAASAAAKFGITRQAIAARLAKLATAGVITAKGRGRSRKYELAVIKRTVKRYPIAGLQEDHVWLDFVKPLVADLPERALDIWVYALTEMVNNAIDHSGGAHVDVGIARDVFRTTMTVADDGEGIFHRVQRLQGLVDARESILELAKGKFTTDPQRHTGEGIFFTSRLVDKFAIMSRTLLFSHDTVSGDWMIDFDDDLAGTYVRMILANDTDRDRVAVLALFSADPEGLTFNRTIVPVRLARHEGDRLVSRSQAKRLVARFERFRDVMLDFAGVEEIGQAFADEVFRVFAMSHPNVTLTPTNASSQVLAMIERARAAGRETEEPK